MPPMLEVENIETYYGRTLALQGVSLAVAQGTITAILGSNGAGKSSLLKTIMGLLDDQPEKGCIRFDGRRIDGHDTAHIVARGISFVPEGREIFEELSVLENLRMGAYLRHDAAGIRRDLDRVYGYFPVLAERRLQLAGTLSGGEQQMLAIGRALMNAPKLLLMDEPSLGLSPLLVQEIFRIIRTIHAGGTTIILVEQNARMALRIADHGYLMENGRFVLEGSAAALMEDEDVKEFYLGLKSTTATKGYQRWKRKKRWR